MTKFEDIQPGAVVVLQFGPTVWIGEVVESAHKFALYGTPQPCIKVLIDPVQFGKASRPTQYGYFNEAGVLAVAQ